ncbi:lantibiotic dehydratase [Actinomadura rupiterrae]|uniref:lantibiotic dehydratase n=1 Tax=Actinomadura rupiterrae TaxID=559627 RepID=UPI003558B0E1
MQQEQVGLVGGPDHPLLTWFPAHLPRPFSAGYTAFDWGPDAEFRTLPRVRYGRCILSLARWRIYATDLPAGTTAWPAWRDALGDWARRYRLPDVVELRDADRTMRLDLTVHAHAVLLRRHLGKAEAVGAARGSGRGRWPGHRHNRSTSGPWPHPVGLDSHARRNPLR